MELKSLSLIIKEELDSKIRNMKYAPNSVGLKLANDLLERIKQLQDEYVVPNRYGSLAYHYGDWLNSQIIVINKPKQPYDDKA